MTRKHFKAIADMIRSMDCSTEQKRQFALGMCVIAQQDNPNFKASRFMTACGLWSFQNTTVERSKTWVIVEQKKWKTDITINGVVNSH